MATLFLRAAIGPALLFSFSQIVPAATFNIADGDVAGLISAINTANSNNQDDTINLAASGNYVLTAANNGSNGLPIIGIDNGHNLTINGNDATIVRSAASGTPEFRFFQMTGNFTNNVTISSLTLTNGYVSSAGGGAIQLDDATTLDLVNCTIANNAATV